MFLSLSSLPANPAPRTARLSTGSEADARTTTAEPRRGAATAEVRAATRAGEARAKAIFFLEVERKKERGASKKGGEESEELDPRPRSLQ